MKINKKILTLIFVLLLLLLFNYFTLSIINLRYNEFFMFLLMFFTVMLITVLAKDDIPRINLRGNFVEGRSSFKKIYIIFFISIAISIIYNISSSPIFFSKSYKNLIGNVETKDFVDNFNNADVNNLPIVDHDLAVQLGDKRLGEEIGLGSEYNVGKFSDITYNGKMMAVAPLEFNDVFKWINNKTTPGYITVDKVSGKVELVNKLGNKDIKLKYLESSFFNNDLLRHVYYNGHMFDNLNITAFELDDNGNPYFVISKLNKTIFINGGEDVKSILLVNAVSGKIKEYNLNNIPKWVDNVYPREIVMKQLNDWGYYVNGFFNTLFAQKNIITTTSGSRTIYNNGMYHYTGLTSVGKDESTVGLAFINTRNKQTSFYKVTGATEEAAMASAEGKVQDLGYNATFPLPININNNPTFLITLKDNKGLVKQYSFINIHDYSKVANNDNLTVAKDNYLKLLDVKVEDAIKTKGFVERIGYNIIDNDIVYYIVVEGNNTIFTGNNLKSLSLTKYKDEVEFSYIGDKIIDFKNKSMGE